MAGKTVIKNTKAAIVKKYARGAADTGSPEVQVALITDRINQINKHLTSFVKDHSSRRGLIHLVGQRRRLLSFLKGTEPQRYAKLIQSLELRK